MWKLVLVFGAGVITGALGASYLAGIDEGRRQALEEGDSLTVDAATCESEKAASAAPA